MHGADQPVPLRRLFVFFATVYVVQGVAEPKAGLATQPIFFLLKDEMRLSAAETAAFFALIGIRLEREAAVRASLGPGPAPRLPSAVVPAP